MDSGNLKFIEIPKCKDCEGRREFNIMSVFDDSKPKYINRPCNNRHIAFSNDYQVKIISLPSCYWSNIFMTRSFREMLDMIFRKIGKELYPFKIGDIPEHEKGNNYVWENIGVTNSQYTYWVKTDFKHLPSFFLSDQKRDFIDHIQTLELPDKYLEDRMMSVIYDMFRVNCEYLKKAKLMSHYGSYWEITLADINKIHKALKDKINSNN